MTADNAATLPAIVDWEDAENPLVKLFVGYDVEGYVEEYELCGDEGDYSPNEQERVILADAIYGVISDVHEKLRKLLRSVAPAGEWQPIATAPKDGTQIIGRTTQEQVFACNWFWDDEDETEGDFLEHGTDVVRPREWLAYPATTASGTSPFPQRGESDEG